MAVKTRKKKAKQAHLNGMEPETIKAVDDAAEIYHDVKLERCKLSKEEDQAKDNLIDKMKEHGLSAYTTSDGIVVTLTSTSNVKTKRKSEPDQEEEDDDEE
jgi:hypothetical protein